jgi:hypothetical protein
MKSIFPTTKRLFIFQGDLPVEVVFALRDVQARTLLARLHGANAEII